uniref:asparagine synthase (glutamine-hydrolyzing) n=1 Tax=Florenciella sp. virus SA2 TaxID=3240092 RepID=A0AB39JF16_9VIRU
MCGIFALLYADLYKLNNDKQLIDKYFEYGKKRGPEYSKITNIKKDIRFGFHRLCINGLNNISNQPIYSDKCILICNGEIYNYKQLVNSFNLEMKTQSDCEVISLLYEKIGMDCINLLDGVFAFVLFDRNTNEIIIGRDPYGVRPLYVCNYANNVIGFSSDLAPLMYNKDFTNIYQFMPATIGKYKRHQLNYECVFMNKYFNNTSYVPLSKLPIEYYMYNVVQKLNNAIKKRVDNCEREIASLLSGGLDSSIISAIVCKEYFKKTGNRLQTYSIGLEGGTDLEYASNVADYIGSNHYELVYSEEQFINSIPQVIYDIESYDTTTVRASVGNWNVAKYISENSEAKVVFNGDGSDELMGGYLYFHCAPNDDEFHNETVRLLSKISHFDVLRSDKSVSSHGLEPRTPFLDKEFTKFYLSIPIEYRNHCNEKRCEKYLIRKAFELYMPDLLPKEVLWRKKEAFSDGVSSEKNSWYSIINKSLETKEMDNCEYVYNEPKTNEQKYYRDIFEKHYPNCEKLLPYFWMPKFVKDSTDASARTLNIYNK